MQLRVDVPTTHTAADVAQLQLSALIHPSPTLHSITLLLIMLPLVCLHVAAQGNA
mgnify:CR=1 FL=1